MCPKMKLWGVLFSITHPPALSHKDLYERQAALPDMGLLKWNGNCPELISMHHSSWGPPCCMASTGYGRWPWPRTTLKPVSVTSEGNGFQKLDHPIGLQYQLTKLSWLSCWSSLSSFLHCPLSKPWALSIFQASETSWGPGRSTGVSVSALLPVQTPWGIYIPLWAAWTSENLVLLP